MSAADDLDAGWDDAPESASPPALLTPAPVSTIVKSRNTAPPPKPIALRPAAAASVPPPVATPTPLPSLSPVTVAPRPRPSRRAPATTSVRPSSPVPSTRREGPAVTASSAPSANDEPTIEIGPAEYLELDELTGDLARS